MTYQDSPSEFVNIQALIKFASQHPLLTKEEEYQLLLRYKTAEDLKLAIISREPKEDAKVWERRLKLFLSATTKDSEAYLAYVAEQKEVKTELLNRNLKLIIKEAKKYMGRGLPLEDLVQEGSTGLLRAIEKFEIERGNKLSTYAVRWIQQRIGRALENKSRLVKIPANILGQINELKRKYKDFTENENRPPTAEEIAEILNIPTEKAKELGRLLYAHVSLDETVGEDDNLSMVNYVVDQQAVSLEERTENKADKEYASQLLSELEPEEARFIKLKYGFMDNKERTDKEMAQLLLIPIKEVREKDMLYLKKLRGLANIEKVNTNINCNLIINKYGSNLEGITHYLTGNTRYTVFQLQKFILPAPVFFEISQHLAIEHKNALEALGASCSIVTVTE